MTFGQKVSKLNSRPVYCLRLYGKRPWCSAVPYVTTGLYHLKKPPCTQFTLVKLKLHKWIYSCIQYLLKVASMLSFFYSYILLCCYFSMLCREEERKKGRKKSAPCLLEEKKIVLRFLPARRVQFAEGK